MVTKFKAVCLHVLTQMTGTHQEVLCLAQAMRMAGFALAFQAFSTCCQGAEVALIVSPCERYY